MSWVVAESLTIEEMQEEGITPEKLAQKWTWVAEDMALIPERNIRMQHENGVVRVEVSQELYDCMRGV